MMDIIPIEKYDRDQKIVQIKGSVLFEDDYLIVLGVNNGNIVIVEKERAQTISDKTAATQVVFGPDGPLRLNEMGIKKKQPGGVVTYYELTYAFSEAEKKWYIGPRSCRWRCRNFTI